VLHQPKKGFFSMNRPNTVIYRIRSVRDCCDFGVFGRPDAGTPSLAMQVATAVSWPYVKPPIAPFLSDAPEAALRFCAERVALFLWACLKAASAQKSRFMVRTHNGEAYTITKFTPNPPCSEKPRQSQKTTSTALIYLHTNAPTGSMAKKAVKTRQNPENSSIKPFFCRNPTENLRKNAKIRIDFKKNGLAFKNFHFNSYIGGVL
jgi:hypothetical protein